VHSEVWISQDDVKEPGGPVGHDELHGLRRVRLQILFEERQFTRRELLRPAVIEDGEVRLPVVEAVMRRLPGVFPKEAFGVLRPDVVVTGGEV
jgi:hypothetical protein